MVMCTRLALLNPMSSPVTAPLGNTVLGWDWLVDGLDDENGREKGKQQNKQTKTESTTQRQLPATWR